MIVSLLFISINITLLNFIVIILFYFIISLYLGVSCLVGDDGGDSGAVRRFQIDAWLDCSHYLSTITSC